MIETEGVRSWSLEVRPVFENGAKWMEVTVEYDTGDSVLLKMTRSDAQQLQEKLAAMITAGIDLLWK